MTEKERKKKQEQLDSLQAAIDNKATFAEMKAADREQVKRMAEALKAELSSADTAPKPGRAKPDRSQMEVSESEAFRFFDSVDDDEEFNFPLYDRAEREVIITTLTEKAKAKFGNADGLAKYAAQWVSDANQAAKANAKTQKGSLKVRDDLDTIAEKAEQIAQAIAKGDKEKAEKLAESIADKADGAAEKIENPPIRKKPKKLSFVDKMANSLVAAFRVAKTKVPKEEITDAKLKKLENITSDFIRRFSAELGTDVAPKGIFGKVKKKISEIFK